MLRQQGTTNGFHYSESLIGGSHADLSRIAVVALPSGNHFAVPKRLGRTMAKRRRAIGFWRLKAYRNGGQES